MAFWDGWALWLKMTFVLGIGIVLVIGAGCCKLVWIHRNLRKHVRLLQERQAEQAALMARPSVRERRRKADIPFGVRAMESGIEIEGIWVSRPNSTATSLVQSPLLSGAATPTSPLETLGEYEETPVAGAARVLANKTRAPASRTYSDPFRDSKAFNRETMPLTGSTNGSTSSSDGSTPYRDLPDTEAGFGNVRMPSNRLSPSNLQRNPSYTAGRNGQPAFYRPTGTPDPSSRPRNSYIPKHLQSRAIGSNSDLVYSPEEYSDQVPLSYVPSAGKQSLDPGAQHKRGLITETSFVTPAGMMPVVPGAPRATDFASRTVSNRTNHNVMPSPKEEDERELVAISQTGSNGGAQYQRRLRTSFKEQFQQQAKPLEDQPQIAPLTLTRAPSSSQPEGHTVNSFATRAEAEAAANADMRKVNDGFSVSRHGFRRNRESLIAEAQVLKEERERRERDRERDREREREKEKDEERARAKDKPEASLPVTNQTTLPLPNERNDRNDRTERNDRAEKDVNTNTNNNRRRLQKKRGSVAHASASASAGALRGQAQSQAAAQAQAQAQAQNRNSQFREQV